MADTGTLRAGGTAFGHAAARIASAADGPCYSLEVHVSILSTFDPCSRTAPTAR